MEQLLERLNVPLPIDLIYSAHSPVKFVTTLSIMSLVTMMSLCVHIVLLVPLMAMHTRLWTRLPLSHRCKGYLSSSYSCLCCHRDSAATTLMGDSSTGDISDRSSKSFCDYEQIPGWLLDTLHRLGLSAPTPVQQRSLPVSSMILPVDRSIDRSMIELR
jgi:hypothetical protein